MSDLETLRDHARSMAIADHSGDCMVRPQLWLKAAPTCGTPGCLSIADRALWRQIANEIDAYLTPEDDGPDLFGGVA